MKSMASSVKVALRWASLLFWTCVTKTHVEPAMNNKANTDHFSPASDPTVVTNSEVHMYIETWMSIRSLLRIPALDGAPQQIEKLEGPSSLV